MKDRNSCTACLDIYYTYISCIFELFDLEKSSPSVFLPIPLVHEPIINLTLSTLRRKYILKTLFS